MIIREVSLDRCSFAAGTFVNDKCITVKVPLLDAQYPVCYKKRLRALRIVFTLCEGAYSAVAQWQSIRLLTEGL